jgi:hypothetical protein
MLFRFKAFGWHLLASATVLSVVLGTLYLGWYHWPGWYLSGVTAVVPLLAGVDLALGPMLTFVIASPKKPRRELKRDVSVIAAVQILALIYGATQLWNGRPLYYAFSVKELSVVQGYDLDPTESALARDKGLPLAPHWYSLPRWIYAPLPDDPAASQKIMQSAITGGYDVTAMPSHFQPWAAGLSDLRAHLVKVGDSTYFSLADRKTLAERMRSAGFDPDVANALPFTGRRRPLLAVFDPKTCALLAILRAT